MFVYKNYRRTGIATKLMQFLEIEFAKNNATSITLKTGRDNKKARKFYKNCGYEKDDEIVYEKELPQ
jgi:ribosomal protein S18 acetylase RimI-like enzyme